jgi:myo-inositol 2-dehydrogenase/D-chiro-inositol 1-dehydrogenase
MSLMVIKFALFGAGRIGALHAGTLAAMPDAELKYVSDPVAEAAQKTAVAAGAEVVEIDRALEDSEVRAVLIASSTDTHADLIERSARAGKAIFCEKPIHLDAERVRECLVVVEETGAPLAIGFNRRFDPHFKEFKARLGAGTIGEVEFVGITSRDPGPPPIEYIRVSGGIFRDMMIHDFDMARWLLGEEPVEVTAQGSCLVEPGIGAAGDLDSAVVSLRTASGRLCQIHNSRRAVYGYDQRLEAHGSEGMLQAGNPPDSTVSQTDAAGTRGDAIGYFFIERYAAAYRVELDAFVEGVRRGSLADSPSGDDGLRALLLADAALESATTGRRVTPRE